MPESTQKALPALPPSPAEGAVVSASAADSEAIAALSVRTLAPEALAPSIEAVLLSVDRPVPGPRLAEALGLVHEAEDAVEPATPTSGKKRGKGAGDRTLTPLGQIEAAIALLNEQYQASKRSFRIERIAGGYRVMTLPAFGAVLEAYHGKRERHALSRAAIETLAIIAYKQPITRAALESIRGVACGEVLRSLMERRLVTIIGRAEELGRPMLYGTSKAFLETFGLASVKDLPSVDDLRPTGSDD